MKVLFLAHAFPPLESSGSLRSRGFAEYLPDYGIAPVIVCANAELERQRHVGASSWVENWKDDPRWPAVERIEWNEGSDVLGFLRRFAFRLPLLATVAFRNLREAKVAALETAAQHRLQCEQPQLIYCSVAPATTALAGLRLARRSKLPLVIDLRDPWSYCPVAPYRHYLDFLLERALERRVLRGASCILTPTEAGRVLLVEKLGVPAQRVVVLPNGFEPVASSQCEPLESGVFTILHAGELAADAQRTSYKSRAKRWFGLDYEPLQRDVSSRSSKAALQAFAQLLQRRPDVRSRVRLHFIGVNTEVTMNMARELACADRVVVAARMPRDDAERAIANADALLLMQVSYWMGRSPFCPAIPAKLYSYLNSGRPIVASAQRSEVTDLIENAGAGWWAEPTEKGGLARIFEAAVDDWISNGRRQHCWAEKSEFTRKALAGGLAEIFRTLIQ